MTVIRPDSISGINSITAQSSTVEFYDPTGNKATVNSENLNVVGIITATQQCWYRNYYHCGCYNRYLI